MKKLIMLRAVLITGLLLPFAASALVIDDFSTDQAVLSVSPDGPTMADSTATGSGIIGAERDMFLSVAPGTSQTTSEARVQADFFTMSSSAQTSSVVTLQWDGGTGGFAATDLTEGSTVDAFEIRFMFADLPNTLDMTVHSSSGSSSISFPGPFLLLTTSLSLFIPFDAFTGGADFSDVFAIELTMSSPTNGSDLSIDYIHTALEPVPVPPAILLFASALMGLGLRRRNA